MDVRPGDTAPDFEAETTEGRLSFHDRIGQEWAMLFSPVCTTELEYLAKIKPELDRRNVKIIESLQLTARRRVATPVNWKHGEDVFIVGSVPDDEAQVIFGEWKAAKPYLRIVPQPR